MEQLLVSFPLATICDSITLAPTGSHVAGSSLSDQALACNQAAASGVATGYALKKIAAAGAAAAGAGVLYYVLHDLAGDGSANPTPDTAAAAPSGTPSTLPPVWPLSDLSTQLQNQNTGLTSGDADVIARTCLWYVAAAGRSAYDECQSKPIFSSGSDVPESTNHDIAALSNYPGWVALTYESSASKSGSWKTTRCQSLTPQGSGYNCDEYPFLATVQGGGTATPAPDLAMIDAVDNQLQGSRYSSFLSTCQMYSKTPPDFLGIPIKPALGITTENICNGGV